MVIASSRRRATRNINFYNISDYFVVFCNGVMRVAHVRTNHFLFRHCYILLQNPGILRSFSAIFRTEHAVCGSVLSRRGTPHKKACQMIKLSVRYV